MILAAADTATGDTDPPPELSDYFIGDLLGSLPFSGGWKEQPMRWVKRVSQYWNVYSAHKSYARARRMNKKDFFEWQKQNKQIIDIVRRVEGLRRGKLD